MKLFYSPGACSIGIHVLLEEIGRPYELTKIDTMAGAQHEPAFTDISPKSKVPVLVRDDGSVLTEFPAIAYFLARANPDARLLPDDTEGQVRSFEMIDYIVATIHMQGFFRQFRPHNVTPNEADHEAVRARGREIAVRGFAILEGQLGGHDYALADHLTIADAALFYVCFWQKLRAKSDLPPKLDALFARLRARPAVQRVLAAEGFAKGYA